MPERVETPFPPIDFGAIRSQETDQERERREWIRKIALAVREWMTARPTGVMVANAVSLSANQDDYEHGQVDVLRVDATGAFTFSGFDATGFHDFWLLNANATNAITLGHEDANSVEANRITSATGANVAVSAGRSKRLWYDADSTRWRILGE